MKKDVCRFVGEENGKDWLFILVKTKKQNTTKIKFFMLVYSLSSSGMMLTGTYSCNVLAKKLTTLFIYFEIECGWIEKL